MAICFHARQFAQRLRSWFEWQHECRRARCWVVGRDATRAFITGEFAGPGLTDDVAGLTPEELKGLWDWRSFYHKDYTYVGKLAGRFYDAEGRPRPLLTAVREGAERAREVVAHDRSLHRMRLWRAVWREAELGVGHCARPRTDDAPRAPACGGLPSRPQKSRAAPRAVDQQQNTIRYLPCAAAHTHHAERRTLHNEGGPSTRYTHPHK